MPNPDDTYSQIDDEPNTKCPCDICTAIGPHNPACECDEFLGWEKWMKERSGGYEETL